MFTRGGIDVVDQNDEQEESGAYDPGHDGGVFTLRSRQSARLILQEKRNSDIKYLTVHVGP